jgi:hypothetical protein
VRHAIIQSVVIHGGIVVTFGIGLIIWISEVLFVYVAMETSKLQRVHAVLAHWLG